MAEQSQGDLRQIYTDLGLTETVPVTTNYMIPVTTSYLDPVSTNYGSPITTLNYPYYSTVDYIITNPNISMNLDGQVQEEIVFDQNIVNVNSGDLPIDMSVPLDMTIKKNTSIVDKDNAVVDEENSAEAGQPEETGVKPVDMTETVENVIVIPAVSVTEDEEFGEVLQKCPICQKMFMKSDYENFHINTHDTVKETALEVSNVPEESATVTTASLLPISEETLYCTEADFQNVIEENVYVTSTNFESGIQENVYATKADFPTVPENNMYVSKPDLQTVDQDNMYVTETDLQSTYQESVYVTSTEFQDLAQNIVYATKTGFENINTESLNVATPPSVVWEGNQASLSNEEVKDYSENFDTPKKLVTIEYREVCSDSEPATSLSADLNSGTVETEVLETSTADYNIPYSIEADVNTSFHINSTAEQALSFEMKTNKGAEIPVNKNEIGLSKIQSTEFGKNGTGDTTEAIIGGIKFPESPASSLPITTLQAAVAETLTATETLCTTRDLPTTVLEFEKEFETEPIIEHLPDNVQNVITEPIIEHLPDNKVTGLSEPYEDSENSKALPKVERMQVAEKTPSELYKKIAEKLKAGENRGSVTETKKEQVSETVASYKFSIIDKDTEKIPKVKERAAVTISTQTEGTFNLPDSCEPVIAETTETSSESYKVNEKEVLDKLEKVDNDSTVNNNEILSSVEQHMPEPALETQREAKSVLNDLYIDEVKSILDELINQASLIEKVEFKSSLDNGIFLCSKCPEMFETNDALKSHLETDHSDEYEAFAVYDPQEEIIVIEDRQVDEKKAKSKIKSSLVKDTEDICRKNEIEKTVDDKKNKGPIQQTKKAEKMETAKAKTPETKKKETVSILDTDIILHGKRKRSINRKFGADFIVDIDIIDDEVKRRKKHSSGSESPRKSPIKQKPDSKQKRKSVLETPKRNETKPTDIDKELTKPQAKVKTNAPFFARLTIQRKLIVISNGLRECPICYRRVYGQLGLKSHMDSHTPDTDKVQDKLKESVQIPFNAFKESPTTKNKVVEESCVSKANVQETDSKIKTEKLSEKSFGKSKKAIQDKLASMQLINKENHECQTCHLKLSTQKGLLMHMKTHQSERESTPEYESKKVIQDKLVTLGNDLHECPICSRMIAGKYPFKLHMNTHKIVPELDESRKDSNGKVKNDTTKKTVGKKENEKVQTPLSVTVKDDKQTEKKDCDLKDTSVRQDSEFEQKNKTVIQEKLATIVGGELHECPICSRLIYGKVRLEAHLKSHSPAKKNIEEQTEVKNSSTENDNATKEKDNSGDLKKEDSKEEAIECPRCTKKVHGQHRLDQHMQTHTRTEQLKENLSRLANQRKEVIQKRVSLDPIVECPICSKQVHGQYRLDAHMKFKHKDDDETEVTFNFKSENRRSLGYERNEKSRKRKAELENATEELNKSETEMEIKNLDGAEMDTLDSPSLNNSSQFVKCTICLKLFRQEYLHQHVQRVHSSDRPFECKICSASFVRKDGLKRHEKRHTNSRDFECNQCDKAFLHKDDLNKHLRRHSGKLGYQCKDCRREFTNNSELAKHQKVHLARSVREHCCNDCGKSFAHYYQVTKHQRLHRKGTVTVAMKHSCTKCGRMFATRSLLEGHLPVHNVLTRARATKHSCRKCGKHFQFRYLLENHMPVHSEKAKDVISIHTRSSTPDHAESKRPKDTIPKLTKPLGIVTKSPALKPKDEKLPPRLTRASTPSLVEVTPHTIVKTNTPASGKTEAVKASKTDKSNIKVEIDSTRDAESANIKSEKNKTADLKSEKTSDLLNHKKTKNSEPEAMRSLSTRKTSCKICGKIFNFKANLMQHLKAHSEIRDFSCGRCGKYFTTQDLLDKHTFLSHKSEEVTCVGCKKKFVHAKSLKRHLIRCVMGKRETRSLGRRK